MEVKPKKCKGIGKAKDYKNACGELDSFRKYGLCRKCLYNWTKETEEGSKWYKESFNNNVNKRKKERRKERRKETKEAKIKILSVDGYRKKYIQHLINKLIRLIDVNCPCIATNNYGKMNAGHYFSVGGNRTLALNLHNIHVQSEHSNNWKGGDNIRYRQGLIVRYSIEYAEFIESLKKHPPLKLTKQDLIELKPKIVKAINYVEKANSLLHNNGSQRSPKIRIELRNEFNEVFGLYELGSDVFI